MHRDFSRGGGAKWAFCPSENGFAPPEVCLNDKIDFNMIKDLPLSIFKRLDLPPPLNLFSKKYLHAYVQLLHACAHVY